ncbi:MAG: TonB-dependent receptor [Xanthomonadales bacterium]|nr:TonB-dependent receptor [Xanthomonadales bacterium]
MAFLKAHRILLVLVILFVLLALLLTPTGVTAQDETDRSRPESATTATAEDAIVLERIEITGSRLKRTDAEGALPVTVFSRQVLEASGEHSLAEFIRSLSFNTFGSYRSQSGVDGMGTSQVDLRGMGSRRTLVLVDGRRLSKAPQSTAYQNLNLIPMGAVERIEVLSDGASAIYGSDAIGGVVNIITRDDYEGAELSYGQGRIDAGGGEREFGTAVLGWSNDRSRIMAAMSRFERDISGAQDFEWYQRSYSFYSNNFQTIDPATGQVNSGVTAIPGGCVQSDAFLLVPDGTSLSGERCTYDFNRMMASENSSTIEGLFLTGEHDINGNWTLWSDATISRSDAFGHWAPRPFSNLFFGAPLAPDSPNNPTNPQSAMFDPAFGPNVPVLYFHRLDALGNRDWFYDTELTDLQLGARGYAGGVSLLFGVRTSRGTTEGDAHNQILPEVILSHINDGTYDLQNPVGNPAQVLDAMTYDNYDAWDYDQDEAFATASWDLFEIKGAPVQWVLGGEFRRESFDWASDSFGDRTETRTDRDVTSLYFETLFPLNEDLELSAAGRYDRYSDWGSDFTPKISMRWRVTDNLLLRASRGEGFRAPQLVINTVEPSEGFGLTYSDQRSCDAIGQPPECLIFYETRFIVSPALTAEHSDQYSVGLVWEPASWASLTLDYFDIELSQEIHSFGQSDVLYADQAGFPVPPGLAVERASNGLITGITHGWANYGGTQTSGIDVNAGLSFDVGTGSLRSNLQLSYVFDWAFQSIGGFDSGNLSGSLGAPQFRATLSNSYEIGDFSVALNSHVIDEQDPYEWDLQNRVPTWVTSDLQFAYEAPWNGRFKLGARNVFNKKPPVGVGAPWRNSDFDYGLYNGWGRTVYAEYTHTLN